MKTIAVFCGASVGVRLEYKAAARMLGQALAARQITLVYGGGAIGLMGELAEGVLSGNGKLIGVIPRVLQDEERPHPGLTELILVDTVGNRKETLQQLADGIITLPGGLGTLDELFGVLSQARMGLHNKPCGLLNTAGYYSRLAAFIDDMVAEGFLKSKHRARLCIHENPVTLIDELVSLVQQRKSQNLAAIPDSLSAWAQESAPTRFT